MRPTISMPKPKSANGCPTGASTCSRSMTIWIPRFPILPSRTSAAAWSNEPVFRTRHSMIWWSASSLAPTMSLRRSRGWQKLRASAKVRMLSHDDESPAMREAFRAHGVDIAEFPVNEETARAAAEAGDAIVFGAPNVVRGGSHTGWTRASDMIAKGLCSILASDYYYPAQLLAAFRLAADGVLPLPDAWDLISAAPARRCGPCGSRNSRGGIVAPISSWSTTNCRCGRALSPSSPRGRLVHLTDATRLIHSSIARRKAVAAA